MGGGVAVRAEVGVEVEERVEVGEEERSGVTVGLKSMEGRGVRETFDEPLSLEKNEEEDCELWEGKGEWDELREAGPVEKVPLVVIVPSPHSLELNPRVGEEEAVPKAPAYTPSGAMEVVGLPLWVG